MAKRRQRGKTFKQAVEATSDVMHCYMEGKLAIPQNERNKIELADPVKCGGRLFIDECLINQNKYLKDNRWDYAIDYNGKVYFIKIHPATSSQVSVMEKKLQWLEDWLNHSAPEIKALKSRNPYHWIQTKDNHIDKYSSYQRRIDGMGLKPVRKLVLK